MTTADSYFEIGHSHKICEDYALHGVLPSGLAYAIVCDGCSSSRRVDVGARIMAHHAETFIRQEFGGQNKLFPFDDFAAIGSFVKIIGPLVISSATNNSRFMNLDSGALDTTLLLAFTFNRHAAVIAFGDGNILFRSADGSQTRICIKYESGAPFYLSYTVNPERAAAYHKQYGQFPVSVLQTDVNTSEKENLLDTGFEVLSPKPADFQFNPYGLYGLTSFILPAVEVLAICSDGIETYQTANVEPVSTDTVCKDILAFKNTKGEFVTRRMNRMKHDYTKVGTVHQDDIAVAALCYEDDEVSK